MGKVDVRAAIATLPDSLEVLAQPDVTEIDLAEEEEAA